MKGYLDPELPVETPAPPKAERRAPVKKKPVDKQSYESNADVQRWLQEQGSAQGMDCG